MSRKPNVIFIFADQMRAHVLGCYGNTIVPTPNFDLMAENGVTFDNAISPWPVCSPYRAMLLSGRHPMGNGTISNDIGMRDDIPTVGKAFKEQGYETGYIGKWHLEWNRDPFVPHHRRMGFDYWAVNNCTHQYLNHFYCTDTPEPIHFEGYDAVVQTDLTIDYIEANREKPFCLFVSWGPPHDPYDRVPEEYKERIPLETITLRENVHQRSIVDHLLERDEPTESLIELRENRRPTIEDHDRLKRECLHGYYAHTAALDDCIGKIRDALRELELADDTVLVFSSDHGDMLGSHCMASKQNPHEESIRVPLIVEYPGVAPKGQRSDALFGPIDVMPTLLSLAGLSCPDVDGKDLASAVRCEDDDHYDAILIMKLLPGGNPYNMNAITPWRGVRTKRYTYATLFDHGPWLLYDIQEDPYQLNNLINNPEYAELQETLETRMRQLMEESGDPGDTHALKAIQASMKAQLN